MPSGVPKYVRCYDDGVSGDRYTVCFTGKAGSNDGWYSYRAMSTHPFHPQGIGLWLANEHRHVDVNKGGWAPAIGRKNHLGTRIEFTDLPADCRRLVLQDYKEIWKI